MNTFFSWRHTILEADLSSTTKLVLLVISTYMNDLGKGAFPSIKTIASNAGLSERAVCTHIAKAEKVGFLIVSKHGFGGQKWARNEYEIAIPAPEALNEVQHEGTESDSPPSPKGTERHSKGIEPDDIKALNEVQSNSPYNSPYNSPVNKHREHDDFESFWKSWPTGFGNKGSKQEAQKAFEKLRPDQALLEIITTAARKQAEAKDQLRIQDTFCENFPHVCRWLKNRRWEDEVESTGSEGTVLDAPDRWIEKFSNMEVV